MHPCITRAPTHKFHVTPKDIPYTAKLLRGKTFAVGIEQYRSRENVHGSGISQ